MADAKISDLAALATTPDNADLAVVVDVSDTSMAASGTDKKITIANLLSGVQPLDADLTAIAALSTTSFGRSLLAAANAAALRTLAGFTVAVDQASAVEIGDGTRALQLWAEAGGPSISSKDDARVLFEAQARWDSDDDGAEGTGIDINKPSVVLRQTGEDHKGAMVEFQQYLSGGTHTLGTATSNPGGTFDAGSAGFKRIGWIVAHYDSPNPVDGIHQHMNFETCMADLATIITRFQISWGEDVAQVGFPNSHVQWFDDKELQIGSDKDVRIKYDTATGRLVASGATWRLGDPAAAVHFDVTNGRLGVGPSATVASPSAPLHLERTTSGQAILARNTDAAGSTGAIVKVEALTAASRALQASLTTDTTSRFSIEMSGLIEWGAGGASARDTNLFRQAADQLRTNDSLIIDTRLIMGGTTGPVVVAGSGTPESAVTAPVGSIFLRTDGGSNTAVYRKESGSGNTGWIASSSNFQPLDADLTAIAALTSAADKGIQFTGSGTAATYDLTTAGKALLDDADASAQRTTLGLGTIATQAANNVTITGGSVTGITDLAVADGGTGASTASAARTNLGLVIGTDVQAWDQDLVDIAGLTRNKGDLIVASSSAWIDLAVGSDGQVLTADTASTGGVKWAAAGAGSVTGGADNLALILNGVS